MKSLFSRCLSLSSPPKSRILLKRNREQHLLLRKRSKSVTENNIPSIVDVPLDGRNLIGDFSGPHTLPIMPGRHSDLAYISSESVLVVSGIKLRIVHNQILSQYRPIKH